MNKSTVYLVWDDCALMIVNAPASILSFLTITVKSIEQPKGPDGKPDYRQESRVVRKKEKLYTEISNAHGCHVIQTFQGFNDVIRKKLEKMKSVEVRFIDKRDELVSPKLERIKDVRFSQGRLVREGLEANKSGLIGAPTRYGKSYIMLNILRCYPTQRILVVIPGEDLLEQTTTFLKKSMSRDIVQIGGGSKYRYQSEKHITTCSADSLHRIEPSEIDLIVADEPHALVTDSRMKQWERFCDKRKVAVGATLEGRFDGKDKLITGLFGPVLAEVTYKEAVDEGAICPLVVLFLEFDLSQETPYSNRNAAYRKLLFQNPDVHEATRIISQDIIPQDHQTLIFIKNEKQAESVLDAIGRGEGVIAMAKRMTKKVRRSFFDLMQAGKVLRCLATNIYAQGVTFSDMRAMVNLEGGGNNTSAIQKPGRLAEIRPGKKYGIIFDTKFIISDPNYPPKAKNWGLVRDSIARDKAFKDKGYEVVHCKDIKELKDAYRKYSQ